MAEKKIVAHWFFESYGCKSCGRRYETVNHHGQTATSRTQNETAKASDLQAAHRRKSLQRVTKKMLVDLERGHRTEVDYLNGKMVRYGHKHCLPTPVNMSVTALVHLLEDSAK